MLLNKAGYPSTRNLSKPWRHVRRNEKTGKPKGVEVMHGHFLDQKDLDENDMPKIKAFTSVTNGTLGSPTSVGRGAPTMVLKVGTKSTPGKASQIKRKSSGGICGHMSNHEGTRAHRLAIEKGIEVWLKLGDVIAVGFDHKTKVPTQKVQVDLYNTIGLRLKDLLPEAEWKALWKRAMARQSTLRGRLLK